MRKVLSVFAVFALLFLSACSGEENSPETTSEKSRSAELEKSVRDYTKILFSGNGELAYNMLSERCQKAYGRDFFMESSRQTHYRYGNLAIQSISVDNISGDLARVSFSVGIPALEREGQPWIHEDGSWRWDACQNSRPNSQRGQAVSSAWPLW